MDLSDFQLVVLDYIVLCCHFMPELAVASDPSFVADVAAHLRQVLDSSGAVLRAYSLWHTPQDCDVFGFPAENGQCTASDSGNALRYLCGLSNLIETVIWCR